MTVENLSQDEQDFEAAFQTESAAKTKLKPQPKAQTEEAGDEGTEGTQEPAQVEPQPTKEPAKDAPAGDTIESLQSAVADALHRERSSANRVSAFSRENNQLKDQVAELQRKVDELTANKPAPVQAAADDPNDVLAEAPELKAAVDRRVREAVDPLVKELGAANKRLTEVDRKADQAARSVEPLVSREDERQNNQVLEALDKSFGGWQEQIRTAEFAGWLKGQTPAIQTLYETGRTFAETSTVLRLYRAEKGVPRSPESQGQGGASRLQNAAGIAPRSVVKAPDNREDFDKSFAEFASRKR